MISAMTGVWNGTAANLSVESALASSTMMRGVVYDGTPYNMTVLNLPRPVLHSSGDAIVRITTSAICGTDLHVYHGVFGGTPPWTMGHEAVGYITQVGTGVASLAVGDYVVIPDAISPAQVEMQPQSDDFFGFGQSGVPGGLQAEYARVPNAEQNLIPLPITHNTTNQSIEMDYLTLADIFATGWAALDFAGLEPGDTVAVFGAGPVGLLSAYSAVLRGASTVYVIDHVQQRLDRAASIGAVPINFAADDPVAQILAREPSGVARSVDCVGMEAYDANLHPDEGIVVQQMINVTRFGGGLGQIGAYSAQPNSAGAPLGSAIDALVAFPMSTFWRKNLRLQSGAVDPKDYASILLDLIQSGRAHPAFIATACVGIEDVPAYYERFSRQEDIKVYIRF